MCCRAEETVAGRDSERTAGDEAGTSPPAPREKFRRRRVDGYAWRALPARSPSKALAPCCWKPADRSSRPGCAGLMLLKTPRFAKANLSEREIYQFIRIFERLCAIVRASHANHVEAVTAKG